MDILFKSITLVTMNADCPVLQNAFLGVENGRICYLDSQPPQQPAARTIDGRKKLLMPGLINGHTHIGMSVLRGYADDLKLQEWLFEHIFPAEAGLDERAVAAGCLLSIAEMLRNGTTSFTDMYFFLPSLAEAVLQSGIKANISNGITDFDAAKFNFEKNRATQEAHEVLLHHHMADAGRMRLDAAIHAEYTSHPAVWEKELAFAQENGLRLHLHLSETKREHEECIQKYGKTPAAVFAQADLFSLPTTAAHCVWVSDQDIALLAQHGVTAVHNPVSNLKLAAGIARVPALLKAGVNVCLGTDSVCSNNSHDLFEELKTAAIVQKTMGDDPTLLPAEQVLRLATQNAARAQGREAECGRLAVGMDADLILLELDAPHLTPCYDPLSTLVYSARGSDVVLTMVRGQILYEQGEFKTLDLEHILWEVNHYAQPLILRNQKKPNR